MRCLRKIPTNLFFEAINKAKQQSFPLLSSLLSCILRSSLNSAERKRSNLPHHWIILFRRGNLRAMKFPLNRLVLTDSREFSTGKSLVVRYAARRRLVIHKRHFLLLLPLSRLKRIRQDISLPPRGRSEKPPRSPSAQAAERCIRR